MPTFRFRNKRTGREKEIFGTIADAEQYEKDHPEMEWLCGAPLIGDPVRQGVRKPSGDFIERLQEIKKKHPRGNINTHR